MTNKFYGAPFSLSFTFDLRKGRMTFVQNTGHKECLQGIFTLITIFTH